MREKLAKGQCRGGKTTRNSYAAGGELADHFPKRSVLAADRFDIAHAQSFEGNDVSSFVRVHGKVLAC